MRRSSTAYSPCPFRSGNRTRFQSALGAWPKAAHTFSPRRNRRSLGLTTVCEDFVGAGFDFFYTVKKANQRSILRSRSPVVVTIFLSNRKKFPTPHGFHRYPAFFHPTPGGESPSCAIRPTPRRAVESSHFPTAVPSTFDFRSPGAALHRSFPREGLSRQVKTG